MTRAFDDIQKAILADRHGFQQAAWNARAKPGELQGDRRVWITYDTAPEGLGSKLLVDRYDGRLFEVVVIQNIQLADAIDPLTVTVRVELPPELRFDPSNRTGTE